MAEEPKVLEEALKDALKAKDDEQNIEVSLESNSIDEAEEEQITAGKVENVFPILDPHLPNIALEL